MAKKLILISLIAIVFRQNLVKCAVTSLQSSDDTLQPSQLNGLSFNNNHNRIPSSFNLSPNVASLSQRNNFYDPSQQPSRFNFPSNSYNPYQQVPQPQYNALPMYPSSNGYSGYGNGYNGVQTFYPNYRQPNSYVSGSGLSPFESGPSVLSSSGYQVPHRQFGPHFASSENRLSPLFSRLTDPKPEEQAKKTTE